MEKLFYPPQTIREESGSRGVHGRAEPVPVRTAQLLEFGCIEQAVQRSALWRLGLSDESWRRILSGISSHVLYL